MAIILKELDNMDFRKLLLYSICFLFYISCEKRFEVDIDGNVRSKQFHLEGNTLTVEAYCVSRVFFYITIRNEHQFEQQGAILFYPDSLDIVFKNRKILYESLNAGSKGGERILDNPISLTKHKSFVILFTQDDPPPFPGDTIILKDMGYLYRNGKRIDIGDVNIVIKK
jgi:hypothetical protein